MPRQILFVHNHPASFVTIDRDLLAERWPVREWFQASRVVNVPALLDAVQKSDVVVGWFASWHMFWPMALARLLKKPTILIIGGYDVANMPEIGYGHQRGGLKKLISRWLIRTATIRMTNSYYSQNEISKNLNLPLDNIRVVYHGVPDRFGPLSTGAREKMALTTGNVDRSNLLRKGLAAFADSAKLLADVQFVLAGAWRDDSAENLLKQAPPNLNLTGWLVSPALDRYYQRASVYVQASYHEGFGVAVAEAMLAGCIPIVTRMGALPELVGEAGVYIDTGSPEAIAAGIRIALDYGFETRQRARERVLSHFSLDMRREGLWTLIEEVLP